MNTQLEKVLRGSPLKFLWSQDHKNIKGITKARINNFRPFSKESIKANNKEEYTTKLKTTRAENLEDLSSKLQESIKKPFNFLNIFPEIKILRSITVDFLTTIFKRRIGIECHRNIWANSLSKPNHTGSESCKLPISYEQNTSSIQQVHEPVKNLDMLQAKIEPVVVQGTGWAGQPIVKRINPILPEIYGDLADTYIAGKSIAGRGLAQKKLISNSDAMRGPKSSKPQLSKTNNASEQGSFTTGSLNIRREEKKMVFNSESIKLDQFKRNKEKILENFLTDQPVPHSKISNTKDKTSKKAKSGVLRSASGSVSQKMLKKKNKTTVCTTKHSTVLSIKKPKLSINKRINSNVSSLNKKDQLQSKLLLNQHGSLQDLPKSVMRVENRQFKTYSPTSQAKVALKVNVKDQSTLVISNTRTQRKNVKKESFPEDCKCPENFEVKTRASTKICGEAAGVDEKKNKKEWKRKMCLVKQKIKQKRKTFVCAPSEKFAKDKRKRQLPKCEIPEKKFTPRVKVCPPALSEELAIGEKKKCVKEVEEVRVRKKTQVCKPVVIYGKEETVVTSEKKVCTESKVQKKLSRHTTVCAPSNANVKGKMSAR